MNTFPSKSQHIFFLGFPGHPTFFGPFHPLSRGAQEDGSSGKSGSSESLEREVGRVDASGWVCCQHESPEHVKIIGVLFRLVLVENRCVPTGLGGAF